MTRLIIFLFLAAPSAAFAWNGVGHLAIAKLAYDQLDEREQLKLFELLKKHPHYQLYLDSGRPDDVSEAQWAALRSAVWPDFVRPRRKDERGLGVTKFHRGEDHYVNIALIEPGDEGFFAGKTLINPDLPNVVTALKHRCNEVTTRTAAPEDRAVALCWVFHLVGDIHQPLHNVSYFSSAPAFQKGDLGGNKFGVRDGSKKWKLHAFWDDLLGTDSNYANDSPGHQRDLYATALKVADRLRAIELTDADKDALANNTSFESWSREGFELAKTVGYRKPDGSMLKGVEVPLDGAVPDDAPDLGEAYVKVARETAERRAIIAAKRLATRTKALLR